MLATRTALPARHLYDSVLHGRFEAFTIHFQPSGLHQLFGLPMTELADRAYDARAVLGCLVGEMQDRLANAATFEARVELVNSMLSRCRKQPESFDPVCILANRLLPEHGVLRVHTAAALFALLFVTTNATGSQRAREQAFAKLPNWSGIWLSDDWVEGNPTGAGPVGNLPLGAHPPYNAQWEARFQAMQAGMCHFGGGKSCVWYFPGVMDGPKARDTDLADTPFDRIRLV